MNEQVLLTRKRLEAKIEDLIALLDLVDGDCDLEDNGDDEPSLGSVPLMGAKRMEYDLEFDDSDREPNGDEVDTNFTEDGN